MFSTESKYGDLLVIVLPKQPPKVFPEIRTRTQTYNIHQIFPLQISSHDNVSLDFLAPGDSVSLLCESDQSKPASDLTWAINGAQVRSLYEMSRDEKWMAYLFTLS